MNPTEVNELLVVLRANGVRTYEASESGAVKVELYPPGTIAAALPLYVDTRPSMAAEAGAVAAPRMPPARPDTVAGGLFNGMERGDPLFRGTEVPEMGGES